jgi:hypothetical protein
MTVDKGASLIESLRDALGDEGAASFQLMGEDMVLVTGARLRAAAERYEAELASVPKELREGFEAEQAAFAREAHDWLKRYNRSLHGRVHGYVELGRRLDFEYPWPVVALLGLTRVIGGLQRNHVYGVLGETVARVPLPGLDALARGIDRVDDLLRRTNRGIFADSVPTVLFALRAHALRRAGDEALARALLDGPLPLLFDEENRRLARALYEGLAIPDAALRFAHLSALTIEHFGREQAIFSHHMGAAKNGGGSKLMARLSRMRSVPAPVIERGRGGARVVFRDFALPEGFDLRDHQARVEAFGRAFVLSVTGSREDYETATQYVERRFG